MKEIECETCIKRKTIYCPNSSECLDTENKPYYQNRIRLLEENKKYKEVIDKISKHCEIEINASNHYLKNHNSQKELCHKVAHQRILDILKEVE